MTNTTWLDREAMALADQLEEAGAANDAEQLRACMAYIRESLDGGDGRRYGLAQALERVMENAGSALELVRAHSAASPR